MSELLAESFRGLLLALANPAAVNDDVTFISNAINFDSTEVKFAEADSSEDWTPLTAAIDSALQASSEVKGGVSEIGSGGCLVRLMSYRAEAMKLAVRHIWGIARRTLLGLEPFEVRKL